MAMGWEAPQADAAKQVGNDAFAGLFAASRARVCRYVRSLVRDDALAEDLAQDVFLKAYRALRQGPPPDNLNAWLYAIATNTALSALRRRKLIAWLPLHGSAEAEERPAAPDLATLAGDRELIAQTLRRLPKQDAACLLLRFQEHLSYAELASALGVSLSAAKSRVCRARATFCETYLELSQEARR